jgi:hypothetical protein
MSDVVQFVFLLLAAISFFAAVWIWRAAPQPTWYGRGFFIALGLLLWIMVPLIETAHRL